jgi:hypothetical protein
MSDECHERTDVSIVCSFERSDIGNSPVIQFLKILRDRCCGFPSVPKRPSERSIRHNPGTLGTCFSGTPVRIKLRTLMLMKLRYNFVCGL